MENLSLASPGLAPRVALVEVCSENGPPGSTAEGGMALFSQKKNPNLEEI